jgi:hypothetical protein
MLTPDEHRIASALRDNPMGLGEVHAPDHEAWRFDLLCMAACVLIAAVTFLAIRLKTGSL